MDPALRVTLSFHPDRLLHGKPVLDAMADAGAYHSQLVAGTSNGGLTAHPGGDRWRWESRIFDGAYDEATAHEPPVYGALDFRRKPVGAAPRFGSAHFRLTARTLTRSTFCCPDSVRETIGFRCRGPHGADELACADRQDELDDYIEAQVHASVRLQRDVEALVLDPCYPARRSRRQPCVLAARCSGTPASDSGLKSSDVTPTTPAIRGSLVGHGQIGGAGTDGGAVLVGFRPCPMW